MDKLRSHAALLATMVVLTACAAADNANPDRAQASATPESVVQVDNRHEHAIVVYLLRSGNRHRLGRVGPLSRATFTIAEPVLQIRQEVRLLLDPAPPGEPDYATKKVTVTPGEQIDLVIGHRLALSSVVVR